MPYVRTHGNQLTIVQGGRDKSTGKVQQRTLFTFYSQKEVAAAIGNDNPKDCRYFQGLLENAYPHLKFNWDKLKNEIVCRMDVLPDIYPLRKVRSEDVFEKTLDEFVRQLVVAAPSESRSGRETLRKYADDLDALQTLITTQLNQVNCYTDDQHITEQFSPLDLNDGFCWRYELQNDEIPADLEEAAAEQYESGDYQNARKLFVLLVRCFPGYAEGHNYLGLIALHQFAPKDAVEHFRMTVKTGRSLFPARIAKSAYWSDLGTRPYMRGLMNLGLALNQAQRYKEALEICDQLYKECGFKGKITAAAHRAAAYLNLHNWTASLEAALEIVDHSPGEGFIAGFALFELGRYCEAIEWFLHASLNNPHTACLLLDHKKPSPATNMEVEDHNSGLFLLHSLPRFFKMQSKPSRKFFRKFIEHEEVKALLVAVRECTRNHFDRERKSTRENFARWHELESHDFAKKKARELIDSLGFVQVAS